MKTKERTFETQTHKQGLSRVNPIKFLNSLHKTRIILKRAVRVG